MPELPEVENVKNNLNNIVGKNNEIVDWIFYRHDLRFKIPKKLLLETKGLKIVEIVRRAKYIVIKLDNNVNIISHLGMTGQWRLGSLAKESKFNLIKHDHILLKLKNNLCLIYNDPRRFGFIEVVNTNKLDKYFEGLGVEPLDDKTDYKKVTDLFLKLKSPIKVALLNQKYVVGIGNIYASEILFRAKVNPLKSCSEVSVNKYGLIWKHTKNVLLEAIKKGGSTISNYKNSYGNEGDFQKNFSVYGRDGELCLKCGALVVSEIIAGRNTFWCKKCQKSS